MKKELEYLHERLSELTENQSVVKDRVLKGRLNLMLELTELFIDNNFSPEEYEIDDFIDFFFK